MKVPSSAYARAVSELGVAANLERHLAGEILKLPTAENPHGMSGTLPTEEQLLEALRRSFWKRLTKMVEDTDMPGT